MKRIKFWLLAIGSLIFPRLETVFCRNYYTFDDNEFVSEKELF